MMRKGEKNVGSEVGVIKGTKDDLGWGSKEGEMWVEIFDEWQRKWKLELVYTVNNFILLKTGSLSPSLYDKYELRARLKKKN